jgi:hypothetical protein
MSALHSLFFLLVSGVALGRPLARLPRDLWSDSSVRRVVPLASFGQTAFGQTTPSRTMPEGYLSKMQMLLDKEWGNAMTPDNALTPMVLRMTVNQVDSIRSQCIGGILLKDVTKGWSDKKVTPRYFVNKQARDHFNRTWRKATVIFARTIPVRNTNVGKQAQASRVGMLWLGGQEAANDVEYLVQNNISVRYVCKERYDCRDDDRFQHGRFVVDRYFGNSYRKIPGRGDITGLKAAIEEIDYMLAQGHSVLLYCRQGARRAASMAMTYLMSKCRLSASTCHRYLTDMRGIVESGLIDDARRLENEGHIYEWFKGDTQVLPAALTETEVLSIADGRAVLQKQTSASKGSRWIKNKEGVAILEQTRSLVHSGAAPSTGQQCGNNAASGQNAASSRMQQYGYAASGQNAASSSAMPFQNATPFKIGRG